MKLTYEVTLVLPDDAPAGEVKSLLSSIRSNIMSEVLHHPDRRGWKARFKLPVSRLDLTPESKSGLDVPQV